jgi:hypothetical protein
MLRNGLWWGCSLLLFAPAMLLLGASTASAYDLAGGQGHTCVIDDNGVACWGDDFYGQATVPTGLINPAALAAGNTHTSGHGSHLRDRRQRRDLLGERLL